MKKVHSGLLGALLVFGLVGISVPAALAGGYGEEGDGNCYCNVPASSVTRSTRVVNEAPRVITHTRVVTTNRVVPHVSVNEHQNIVIHRRLVLNKNIIVHRQNVLEKNIIVNRNKTIHRYAESTRNVVENKNQINRRSVTLHRNCNCGPGEVGYRGGSRYAVRSLY